MDLTKLPIFSTMNARLRWLTEREQAIAQNVANLDTPGYRPTDLKPVDFAVMAKGFGQQLAMAPSSSQALSGTLGGAQYRAEKERKPYAVELSGNGVVLEEQLMKAADTHSNYALVMNLYRKQLSLFKTALGSR